MKNMNKAYQLFKKYVCKKYSESELIDTITDIVIDKKVSSTFLVYAIKRWHYSGNKIWNPRTLYIIVKNREILCAWKNNVTPITIEIIEIERESDAPILSKPLKKKRLGDILYGKYK